MSSKHKVKSILCPFCGSNTPLNSILTNNENIQMIKKTFSTAAERFKSSLILINSFYLAMKHPTEENSIIINRYKASIKYKEDVSINDVAFTQISSLEIIPNKGAFAYKIKNKKEEPISCFDFFCINKNTIEKDNNDIIWEEPNNTLKEFLDENKKFADYTGLINSISQQTKYSWPLFFKIYFSVYEKYPSIEKISKSGMGYLIENVIEKCLSGVSKRDILNIVDNLKSIINPEATNAKDAINLPNWMINIFILQKASIETINFWIGIFSYDNISKENFIKLITSKEYSYEINCFPWNNSTSRNSFIDVLKFRKFTFKEILKYINDQNKLLNCYNGRTILYLKDYLHLCELMGSIPDALPSNILSAHNALFEAYEAKKDSVVDSTLKSIADKFTPFIPDNEHYTIVIPSCIDDFVKEGNEQHNCVASYVDRCVRKDTFVYFIREKEFAEKSFITVEMNKSGIHQILYKYNATCHNKNILEFANKFFKATYTILP